MDPVKSRPALDHQRRAAQEPALPQHRDEAGLARGLSLRQGRAQASAVRGRRARIRGHKRLPPGGRLGEYTDVDDGPCPRPAQRSRMRRELADLPPDWTRRK